MPYSLWCVHAVAIGATSVPLFVISNNGNVDAIGNKTVNGITNVSHTKDVKWFVSTG